MYVSKNEETDSIDSRGCAKAGGFQINNLNRPPAVSMYIYSHRTEINWFFFLTFLKVVTIKLKAVDLILRVKVLALLMQSQVSVIELSCNWFQAPSYGGSHIF